MMTCYSAPCLRVFQHMLEKILNQCKEGCLNLFKEMHRILLYVYYHNLCTQFPVDGNSDNHRDIILHVSEYTWNKFLELELLNQRKCVFLLLIGIAKLFFMEVLPISTLPDKI